MWAKIKIKLERTVKKFQEIYVVTRYYHNIGTYLLNHLQYRFCYNINTCSNTPPLMETTVKILFWYLPEFICCVGFDIFDGVKTITFEAHFDFGEEPEI